MIRMIWKMIDIICRGMQRLIISPVKKRLLGNCGNRVFLRKGTNFTWKNVHIGNNVYVGSEALFMCTRAKTYIGDNVMFGPRVVMITGGHRIDVVGRYMISITDKEKSPEDDRDIILEGDNWIGANATILRGVTLGKGSVVAAGAVVTKDVAPFTVVGGIPAKLIRKRFDDETLLRHLQLLEDTNSGKV